MSVSTGLFTGGALFLLCTAYLVSGDCDNRTGPANALHCVPGIEGGLSTQWWTCVAGAYLSARSQGLHQCADTTAAYCYYPCMVEVYNKLWGVYSSCACNPNDTTPTPQVTLDPQCFSPTGEDCDWYSDCLEKKIPCAGGGDGYAIEYADKFCRRFQEYSSSLSSTARQWMEDARKCLQLSLVPALRPFILPSCSTVKQLAFGSHSDCYYRPGGRQAPSFCDLQCSDWWQVFWIIKSAFLSDPWDNILGMMQVGKRCTTWETECFQTATRLLRVSLILPRDLMGPNTSQVHYHTLAAEATSSIARQLGWGDMGLIWFSLGVKDVTNSTLYVRILLADKRQYGLLGGAPVLNISKVIEDASNEFSKGSLNATLNSKRVQLLELEGCQGAGCISPQFLATASANSQDTSLAPITGNSQESSLADVTSTRRASNSQDTVSMSHSTMGLTVFCALSLAFFYF